MRPLTGREKRTLRLGGAGLAAYLVLYFGWQGFQSLETRRAAYQELRAQADLLDLTMLTEATKARRLEKLRERFPLVPQALPGPSLVGGVNEALQRAAQAAGLQLGPLREGPGRSAAGEAASLQVEGAGPTGAAVQFLHGLRSLGFPLVLDSLQVKPVAGGPGQVQISLTAVVLDATAWKETGSEKPRGT